jgi:hypothetical protein
VILGLFSVTRFVNNADGMSRASSFDPKQIECPFVEISQPRQVHHGADSVLGVKNDGDDDAFAGG